MPWNASGLKRNEPSKKHHLSLGSVRAGSSHAECCHSAARPTPAKIDKSSSNLMSVGSDALGLCNRHRRAQERATDILLEKIKLEEAVQSHSSVGLRGVWVVAARCCADALER